MSNFYVLILLICEHLCFRFKFFSYYFGQLCKILTYVVILVWITIGSFSERKTLCEYDKMRIRMDTQYIQSLTFLFLVVNHRHTHIYTHTDSHTHNKRFNKDLIHILREKGSYIEHSFSFLKIDTQNKKRPK